VIEPEPFVEESARSAMQWMNLVQTHLRHQVEILRTALLRPRRRSSERELGLWCVERGGERGAPAAMAADDH